MSPLEASRGSAPAADGLAEGRSEVRPRGTLLRLIEELAAAEVGYCHWKSSISFDRVMSGGGDLDLLVDRAEAGKFEGVLGNLGYRRVLDSRSDIPSVFHFYNLDSESGALIHLHVYYKLMAGEALLKNYRFPVERMLLEESAPFHGIPVPRPEAELPVLVLRSILKYSTVIECVARHLDRKDRRGELERLIARASRSESIRMLREWLPQVSPDLYERSLDSLRRPTGTLRKIRLGRKVRRALRGSRRHGALREMFMRSRIVAVGVMKRARRLRGSRRLATGGAVIAFTGPETRGRSMVARQTAEWLGGVFRVRRVSWPEATWGSNLVSALPIPLVRRFHGGAEAAKLRRVQRHAAAGDLVICDGYGPPGEAPPDIEIRLEGATVTHEPRETGRRDPTRAHTIRIDTSGPAEETIRRVRHALWSAL